MGKVDIHKDFLDYIENFVSKPQRITGFAYLDEDFEATRLTWAIIFNIFSYLIINGIDIYIVSEDLKSCCFCMVTYNFGFLFIGRIINMLSTVDEVHDLRNILLGFNFDEDYEAEEREMYLKYGRISKILGSIGSVISISCLVGIILFSPILWLATGTRELTLGFFIPGFGMDTVEGYLVNYFYQNMQVIFTVSGLIGFLHGQILFSLCACFQIDLIMIKLKKLDKQLLCRQDPCREDLTRKVTFTEILKLHQNLNEFLNSLEETYSFELFNNMFFYSLTLIITLFVCVKEIWIIGYMIIVTVSYLLMIPCLYGVAIEIKSDQLVAAIYDIQWFYLSREDQKMLILFLQVAQNSNLLTYGGLLPLNLETFAQVYYSQPFAIRHYSSKINSKCNKCKTDSDRT